MTHPDLMHYGRGPHDEDDVPELNKKGVDNKCLYEYAPQASPLMRTTPLRMWIPVGMVLGMWTLLLTGIYFLKS